MADVALRTLYLNILGRYQGQAAMQAAKKDAAEVEGAMVGAGAAAESSAMKFSGLGFAAAAGIGMTLRAVAQFQQQTTLASLAAGGLGVSLASVTRTSLDLSKALGQSPTAMATLIRQVDQMGDPARRFNQEIGQAAVRLSALTGGDLSSDAAAQGIYRLLQATTHSQAEFESALQSANRYASAIYAAGHMSSAGVPGTLKMVQQLEALGTMANFSTTQIISLSAAIGNLGEARGGQMATALNRMFGSTFTNPQEKGILANFLGMTPQEFESERIQKPFEMLTHLMHALDAANKSGRYGDTTSVLRILGLENAGDVRTMAALIQAMNVGNFGAIQGTISGQMNAPEDQLALMKDHSLVMNTLLGQWGQFTSALSRAAIVIGEQLVPVLGPLLSALTGILNTISEHPWLARMIALGAVSRGVGAVAGLARGGAGGLMQLVGATSMGMGMGGGGGQRAGGGLGMLYWVGGRGRNMAAGAAAGRASGGFGGMLAGGARGLFGRGGSKLAATGTFADLEGAAAKPGLLSMMGRGIGGLASRGSAWMGSGIARGAMALGMEEGGAASLGAAAGPIGLAIAAVGLLQPVFQSLTGFFQNMGQMGGVAGAVGKVLAALTNILAQLGKVVNGLMNTIGDWLGKLGGFLHGIGEATGINGVLNNVGKGLDSLANWGNDSGKTAVSAPGSTINMFNITTTTQDQTLDTLRSVQAVQAVSGTNTVAYAR